MAEVLRTLKKNGAKNKEINVSIKEVMPAIAKMRAEREDRELAERKAQIISDQGHSCYNESMTESIGELVSA